MQPLEPDVLWARASAYLAVLEYFPGHAHQVLSRGLKRHYKEEIDAFESLHKNQNLNVLVFLFGGGTTAGSSLLDGAAYGCAIN